MSTLFDGMPLFGEPAPARGGSGEHKAPSAAAADLLVGLNDRQRSSRAAVT